MKIIFSHGKESGPWGTKIKYLAKIAEGLGCDIESIDFRGIADPDARVEKLIHSIRNLKGAEDDFILAGSSMGGYVSLVAASQLNVDGVFLMAPALYMPGYEKAEYTLEQRNVCIVHGWQDEIIPWQNSLRYAELTQCELHLLQSDHRLTGVLTEIDEIFSVYLKKRL